MSSPTVFELLQDVTGTANNPTSTGVLDVRDFDQIGYTVTASGAITASTITITGYADAAGANTLFSRGGAWTAATTYASAGVGPGNTYAIQGAVSIPTAVPAYLRIDTSAAGVGITVTIKVWGRRNHRGPDVSSNPD